MKKEIKDLLKQDEGKLKINEAFKLVRWKLNPETDILGQDGEYLRLEMLTVNDGRRNFYSKEIKSRDVQGIMDEVATGMNEIMAKYTDQLVRRWKGGLL